MNQPTLMTRFIGMPRVAAVVYIGACLAVMGWMGGEVSWWLALIALGIAGKARVAVQDVRAYNQWWAAWQAMGPPRRAAPEPRPNSNVRKRKASSSRGIVIAAVSLLVIPLLMASLKADDALYSGMGLLWLAVALYLLFKLIPKLYRLVVRRSPSSSARAVSAGAKGDETLDLVAWALPPASSSPSRADAMRMLPDYCARLLRE
jgi:hypothetical protein